ncbi:PREDICTED: DDB1- and CUL4-associated factor 8-like protein 2 [Acropora digitifera]|uniref:DDB1- and CUL4-associated factor 8-like protein 2 n=1 Tax=Acropora digitifera TaxID=70779 RepID=UPI00077AC130|nr:PREDICTED: DDB1- and CUL4-associated factor 8-like protein 2 [Acropora digitifera]
MARASNPFVSNLEHRQLGMLSPMNFSRQISGSCGLVKRLSLHHKLEHHQRCVNTLHFNTSGDLLASGSDDPDIVIWDWAKGEKKIAYKSGHINDVLQVKFMPYNDATIVSCAGDGKVHVGFFYPSSGEGRTSTKCLTQHDGAAYMLCIQPGSAYEFLTCGEDGAVFHADLRVEKVNKLFCCRTEERREVPLYTICSNPQSIYEFAVGGRDQFARVYDRRKIPMLCIQPGSAYEFLTCGEDGAVFHADLRVEKVNKLFCCRTEERREVPLYTICSNPQSIYEFAVGGRDQFARVYDRRKIPMNNNAFAEPVKTFCPHHLREGSDVHAKITCLVYSYNGTELLVSYSDENIYLFNSWASQQCRMPDPANLIADVMFLRYTGRKPFLRVMDVNFFGPQSEYIVSGSDCGHIFFWDKQTEEVVQFLQGNNTEADICLEPHPQAPILATSGFDHDIKLWLPTAEHPTDLDGLENVIRSNDREREIDRQHHPNQNEDPLIMQIFHHFRRHQLRNENREPDSDNDLADDEDDDNNDEESVFFNRVQCSPS